MSDVLPNNRPLEGPGHVHCQPTCIIVSQNKCQASKYFTKTNIIYKLSYITLKLELWKLFKITKHLSVCRANIAD